MITGSVVDHIVRNVRSMATRYYPNCFKGKGKPIYAHAGLHSDDAKKFYDEIMADSTALRNIEFDLTVAKDDFYHIEVGDKKLNMDRYRQ